MTDQCHEKIPARASEPDEPPGPARDSAEDSVPAVAARPERPRGFSISQDDLTVPKPSYHDHRGELEALPDAESAWKEADTETADYQAAAASKDRARKRRIWGFLVFLMFIYAVFRTMRFMR